MNVLTSSEFRRQYAKLTEMTAVTVNGHVIGYWNPHVPSSKEAPLLPIATIYDDGQGGQVRRREPTNYTVENVHKAAENLVRNAGAIAVERDVPGSMPAKFEPYVPQFRPVPKPTRRHR